MTAVRLCISSGDRPEVCREHRRRKDGCPDTALFFRPDPTPVEPTIRVELREGELHRIMEALWCGPPEEVTASEYDLLAKLARAQEGTS